MSRHYLAFDLGAESGRLMAGTLAEGRLTLEEVHRFPNGPISVEGSLHWDIPRLFREVRAGLAAAAALGREWTSISADSWGVDYVLLDANGDLMSPTFCYRDPRTEAGVKRALAQVPWETIFSETGIQFMRLNTLFQLAAETPERLSRAKVILGVADGVNALLCGRQVMEVSMASTFQLYNPVSGSWSRKLIAALALPPELFPEVIASGTRLGPLRASVAEASGLGPIEVVATCSHDTGAAVAAVPAEGEDWAYLSSGTWSLMGVELAAPILSGACRELNFTNEIGFGNSIRLLKNIIGLWIIQECRRHWAEAGREFEYRELAELAGAAAPLRAFIDPADARFVGPGDMPLKIAGFCRETGQPVPEDPGAVIRCALESLAMLYRRTLEEVRELTGRTIRRLHVVGGGSRNRLLNQLTANALGIPVIAGPAEATAAGNVLIQAIAMDQLSSLAEARAVVRKSFAPETFEPNDGAAWDEAYGRFRAVSGSTVIR